MARIHEIIAQTIKDKGGVVASTKPGSGIKFAYRGVEDVVTHLADALNEAQVIYWPIVTEKDVTTRDVGNGKAITTSSVVVDYVFHAVEDDSELLTTVPGLAMDYADRSDAQSMSVALRTALIQIFRLQAGDKDPEQTGEEANNEATKAATESKGTKPPAAKARTAAMARTEIQSIIADQGDYVAYGGEEINALGEKHSENKGPTVWMNDLDVLEKIIASVKAGELV